MSCTCFKRQYPCPIHKDQPLPQVDEYVDTTIIIRVHGIWINGTLKYYTTMVQDAIQVNKSKPVETKEEALGGIEL